MPVPEISSRLNSRVEGSGSRVVLVHGFTQTLAFWELIASRLASSHEVVRIDLPGHGGSSGLALDFRSAALCIGETAGRATYVGYSLGGRLCLALALERPELVSSLVLLGASPGIEDEVERFERRKSDNALANDLERDGVEPFLTRWLSQPLFATLSQDAAGLEARRMNTASGLAMSLRRHGAGEMEPLLGRLHELDMPVLVMAGSLDDKYTRLGKQMVEHIGSSAQLVLLNGAGHAAHLEQPDRFTELVEAFLLGQKEVDLA